MILWKKVNETNEKLINSKNIDTFFAHWWSKNLTLSTSMCSLTVIHQTWHREWMIMRPVATLWNRLLSLKLYRIARYVRILAFLLISILLSSRSHSLSTFSIQNCFAWNAVVCFFTTLIRSCLHYPESPWHHLLPRIVYRLTLAHQSTQSNYLPVNFQKLMILSDLIKVSWSILFRGQIRFWIIEVDGNHRFRRMCQLFEFLWIFRDISQIRNRFSHNPNIWK